ncbi:MAG TPA: DUF1553 domain-containing protein, partial [Chthoniobacteraceae bacterium]|nr:DUF1553 domain-containing protein [Chthoniobacteraceae bacterium]
SKTIASAATLIFAAIIAAGSVAHAAPIKLEYNRDVRPILSDKCFKCHGPDSQARKAELRLDIRDNALAKHDNGIPIVPGKPDESELVQRIETSDPDDHMPPRKSNLRLSKDEIARLRRWVAEGAEYQPHWSLIAPRARIPDCSARLDDLAKRDPARAAEFRHWPKNPIDQFVLDHLLAEGLAPSAEADPATLVRRMSLDLTGLPPTPAEVDAFVIESHHSHSSHEMNETNGTDAACAHLADRLLASPRFGERMALDWLDAARYADTNGYFRDNARQAWPWRDWVINAFNRNMPFDQFTIEQLAGDLLPNATTEQKIATGFNRNHMVTGESGIIDEEYRVEYVADRLETTSTVWLGLTVGCCRCHDHKFDAITQREYYQLFAFFNNGPETGLVKEDDPPPTLDVATPEQRAELERLGETRRGAETTFRQIAEPLRARIADWEKTSDAELAPLTGQLAAHVAFEPDLASADDVESRAVAKGGNVAFEPGLLGHAALFDAMEHIELPADLALEAGQPWSIGLWMKPTGSLNCVLSKIDPSGERRGFEMLWQKGQVQINLVHRWVASAIEVSTKEPMKRRDWHQVIVSYDGSRKAAGVRVFIDGNEAPLNVARDSLDGPIGNSQPLRIGRRDNGLGFYGHLDELRVFRRPIDGDEAKAWYWSDRVRGILAVAPDKRDAKQNELLLDYYVEQHTDPGTRAAHDAAIAAREAEEKFRAQLPKTLVMQERPQPRTAHVLKRGQYDQPGDEVRADVPASLPPLPADAPRNRLGLARWLVSPSHPLTARVEVNRLWQQCFGEGLVRTANDFGVQGEPPTHPELLDWLAVHFVESGWDVKAMLKLIVTSATYRQSSIPSPALLARDPENRLLARGPRFRLSAETIRDQALAASGLLVERIGGPSVKPYQPVGLWEAVSYDGELSYQQDKGDGLWRRSLYTFWKRQSPPPALLIFDGPTRETCVVRRPRTNTPLQALVLWNDETYVEAARALAAHAIADGGASDDDRLRFAFRRVTARTPDNDELRVLRHLL